MDHATDVDILFMHTALEQARLASQLGEVPVGAVSVCENRIIVSPGVCSDEASTLMKSFFQNRRRET